jgi:DNA helicase-2/ATP-dependent DNA helicase PcrA
VFEDALRKAKIPYKIVGGIRFYDRREIKDLLAYLKAVAVPEDDVSLKRILNVPTRGIGKRAVELLEDFRRANDLSLDRTLRRAPEIPELGPKASKAVGDFVKMMDTFRKAHAKLTVRELLEAVIEKTEYVKLLELERTIEAGARIENIEELFSVVDDYEENEKEASLAGFIESVTLLTDIDTWDAGSNYLTLMTLHSAKGLEFPLVFMVGLEAGLFPHINSLAEGSDEELEEERRLCYVGITRTQEKLHLSYATSRRLYGQHAANLPSRFLTEIPTELLEFRGQALADDEVTAHDSPDEIKVDYDLDES